MPNVLNIFYKYCSWDKQTTPFTLFLSIFITRIFFASQNISSQTRFSAVLLSSPCSGTINISLTYKSTLSIFNFTTNLNFSIGRTSSTIESVYATMLVNHASFLMSSRSTDNNGVLLLFSTFVSLTSSVLMSIVSLCLCCSYKLGVSNFSCCRTLLCLLLPWEISYWFFNMKDLSKVTFHTIDYLLILKTPEPKPLHTCAKTQEYSILGFCDQTYFP